MYTPNLYLCQILFCIFDTTIETKKPFSLIAKGLGISKLPLLESFRTFKEDIGIENIRLNQLILQY